MEKNKFDEIRKEAWKLAKEFAKEMKPDEADAMYDIYYFIKKKKKDVYEEIGEDSA